MMTVTVVAGVGPGGEIEWLVADGRELLEELEVKGAANDDHHFGRPHGP